METKTTLLKSSLLALFLMFISSTAFSATYFVCAGPLTLTAPAPTGGVTQLWDVKVGGISITGYPSATAPTGLVVTAGTTYSVTLTSTPPANSIVCAPATASDDYIALPPLTLTIGAPTNGGTYCGASTSPSSAITPASTGLPTGGSYDTELTVEYTYSIVKDGAVGSPTVITSATVGGIGSIDVNGVFTLTTTTPGSYEVTGTVKYKNKGAFTSLASPSKCPTTAVATRTIVVTAAPIAPVITVGP
jgi:hypothetical protein